MSPTLLDPAAAQTSNVRLVAVDEHHRPRYLIRAAELTKALLAVASRAGIEPEDLPSLHGMCIEAVRSAEQHGR
jgi:hypothetical protein